MPSKNASNSAAPSRKRLPSADRRAAIIRDVCEIFAQEGFHGVTTKQLAVEAGVSEALLYRHFSSKEALFEEVLESINTVPDILANVARQLDSSTESMITMMYLMCMVVIRRPSIAEGVDLVPKMMMQSLLDDGRFSREYLERNLIVHLGHIKDSIEASDLAGDTFEISTDPLTRFWLSYNALYMMKFNSIPGNSPIDYVSEGDKLVEDALKFVLRGIGYKPEIIESHVNIPVLRVTTERLMKNEVATP